MSTTDDTLEHPPISVWRRLLVLAGVLTVVCVVLGGWRWYHDRSRTSRQMERLLTELDGKGEPWRLDEIEAARDDPPPGRNSAVVLQKVVALLPRNWPSTSFDEKTQGVSPPNLLDPHQRRLLEDDLDKIAPAILQARVLADMPRGRHRLVHAANPLGTLLNDQQETRRVGTLLAQDAWRLANQGDVAGALRSCRACINVGRSLGDEPYLISQLIRVAVVTVAASAVERSLALGEAGDDDLARLQQLLELEERHPTFLVAIRGERGVQQKLWEGLASGALSSQGFYTDSFGLDPSRKSWREWIFAPSRYDFRRQQPQMLELMNRLVEIARLPPHEQTTLLQKVEAEIRALPRSSVVRILIPAVSRAAQGYHRKTALVTTLRVLVATERYRLRTGRWPEKLEELTPGLLDRVPVDPLDGNPLRFRRLPEGVVVYSVGDDRKDDGGVLDHRRGTFPGTDCGFRLWNVSLRRQPPVEPPPEKPQ